MSTMIKQKVYPGFSLGEKVEVRSIQNNQLYRFKGFVSRANRKLEKDFYFVIAEDQSLHGVFHASSIMLLDEKGEPIYRSPGP